MDNKALERYLKDTYIKYDFTEGHYIVVIKDDDNLMKALFINRHFIEYGTLDKASKGQGARIRYRQTKELTRLLKDIAQQSFTLCTYESFEILNKFIHNKGDTAECIVYNYFFMEWARNNEPFYKAGDIIVNDIPRQIKYSECSFITEALANKLNGL